MGTKTPAEEAAYLAGRQDAQLLCNLYFAGAVGRTPTLTSGEPTTICNYIERRGRECDRFEPLPDNCVVVFRGGNATCLLPIKT